MNIIEATASYEKWLAEKLELVKPDLKRKHALMREDCFAFLRGTYYRWAQLWPDACAEMAKAPHLLAIGDLHLANFGTWRDAEGRLVWGINDFDEACMVSYANDLVRLATSVLLAIDDQSLKIGGKRAVREILKGYTASLKDKSPLPLVLEENNLDLRNIALSESRSPKAFWKKLASESKTEKKGKHALAPHLPHGSANTSFAQRTAGVGSLGLPRYVATAECNGGLIAREAKARAPSAHAWAQNGLPRPAEYEPIVKRAVRAPDPFLKIEEKWIIRRLAPDCSRIELEDIARGSELSAMFNAMGRETANIHRGGGPVVAKIRRHLAAQKSNWLYKAASHMADVTLKDWKTWKKG